MSFKKWLGLLILAGVIIGGYRVMQIVDNLALPHSEEEIAAVVATAEAQDEEAFYRPERSPLEIKQSNPLNNVFFGDLHVHTNLSVDAYLFGNRFNMDTAYQVAKGKSVKLRSGERVELTRPLDFVALTDHAEGFGRIFACREPDKTKAAQDILSLIHI